jgi:hypothetical protein
MKYIKKTSFNAEEKSVATKHEFAGPTLTTPTYALIQCRGKKRCNKA